MFENVSCSFGHGQITFVCLLFLLDSSKSVVTIIMTGVPFIGTGKKAEIIIKRVEGNKNSRISKKWEEVSEEKG